MQRIFLTGIRGSGKSTVGRQVAQFLGWDFLDTDDLLSERTGLPCGQVLIEYGEPRFRELEAEALRSAATHERMVIATGGGVVIAEAHRTFMRTHGLTVYLQVSAEIAWQRIQGHLQQVGVKALRPSLTGADGLQDLQHIYAARQQWYEEAEVSLNTDTLSPEIVARQVVAHAVVGGHLSSPSLTRETMTLDLGSVSSQAIVEWGGLQHLPHVLHSLRVPLRLFIVTDTHVGQIYAEAVQSLLAKAGFVPHIFTVPAGESSKSLLCFQQIIDWLIEQKVERQETVIALGGGVVGDLAGFVAASYNRGVPFIQIPTSLLAQIDAAIGGKTGINHPKGKNKIGAFYQPKLTLVDPATLLTLPERSYREGWAEIVKTGIILDADLFQLLEAQTPALLARDAALLTTIIARCVRWKMDVVQRDEREGGLRAILNYGHTFAHALEAVTDYGTWLHGEAVSIGMEVAAQIAVARGLFSPEDATRQHNLLCAFDLPVCCGDINMEAALMAMQQDKKVQDGRLRWILPISIGHVEVYEDIPASIVREAVEGVTIGNEKDTCSART